MKTTAMFVILVLGACFYMSTAAPSKLTEVYNQVAKAEQVDECFVCSLLMDHLSTYSEGHFSCYSSAAIL